MKTNLMQELQLERVAFLERQLRFHPSKSDDAHFIVYCKETGGQEEIIGHVYIDNNGEYVTTDANGQELFQPTDDFNTVSRQFDLCTTVGNRKIPAGN